MRSSHSDILLGSLLTLRTVRELSVEDSGWHEGALSGPSVTLGCTIRCLMQRVTLFVPPSERLVSALNAIIGATWSGLRLSLCASLRVFVSGRAFPLTCSSCSQPAQPRLVCFVTLILAPITRLECCRVSGPGHCSFVRAFRATDSSSLGRHVSPPLLLAVPSLTPLYTTKMNAFASLISFIEALAALFHPRTVTGVPNEVDIKALIGSPLHLAAATLVFYVIPLAIACFIISLFLGLLVIALLFVIAFICEGEAWLGGYEHQELRGVTVRCSLSIFKAVNSRRHRTHALSCAVSSPRYGEITQRSTRSRCVSVVLGEQLCAYDDPLSSSRPSLTACGTSRKRNSSAAHSTTSSSHSPSATPSPLRF